ncbi:MAG: hypothetical protein LiPW15_308 [Parcubacteria group bacterium LiPW_15]|nr:MAG: hypothetical protein LiPW15_308 [Parcubacteria group bacterium LiPW_15]
MRCIFIGFRELNLGEIPTFNNLFCFAKHSGSAEALLLPPGATDYNF